MHKIHELVEKLESDVDRLTGENARLKIRLGRVLDAIYERGESPRVQRRQIDPVDYLRTRYVSVREYSEGVVSAIETFAKRDS